MEHLSVLKKLFNIPQNTPLKAYLQYIYSRFNSDSLLVVYEVLVVLLIVKILFMRVPKTNSILNVRSKKDKQRLEKEAKRRLKEFSPEPLVPNSAPFTNDAKYMLNQQKDIHNYAMYNFYDFRFNKDLMELAKKVISVCGVGTCGPRGFYGTTESHLSLEEKIAAFLRAESAIIYSSGFSTVSSCIPAYIKFGDIAFVDESVNSAVLTGLTSAKTAVYFYKHNDLSDLAEKIQKTQLTNNNNNKSLRYFIVTEAVFQADGSITDLQELVLIKNKFCCRLFIDESLSFGLLGERGAGLTEHCNVDISQVDLIMANLEYYFSTIGGFAAGNHHVIDHQRLSSLGYCFSASAPAFYSEVTVAAIDMIQEKSLNKKLVTLSKMFHQHLLLNLKDTKFELVSKEIVPVKIVQLKSSAKLNSATVFRNLQGDMLINENFKAATLVKSNRSNIGLINKIVNNNKKCEFAKTTTTTNTTNNINQSNSETSWLEINLSIANSAEDYEKFAQSLCRLLKKY